MKIYLLVTPFFPSPEDWRGSYAYDFILAVIRDERYRVIVMKPGKSYTFNGVRVNGFRELSVPGGVPFPGVAAINRLLFRKALKDIGVYVEDIAVADAFTNGRIGLLLPLKKRNPQLKIVTHHHDPASFGISLGRLRHVYLFKLIRFFKMRYLQSQVDLHVYVSKRVKRSFEMFPDTLWTIYEDYRKIGNGLRLFHGARVKDSYVLHNGVNKDVFKYVKRSIGDEVPADRFAIGCVANFVNWKDQITLLKAIAHLADQRIAMIFVGSGPTIDVCKAYAHDNGLNVEFRKEMRHEDLVGFFAKIDLFVLPSYFEGFGCVFTEAHSCGVPFITCTGQGVEDIIDESDQERWLCMPRDFVDLAQKISRCITDWERNELRPERLNEDQDINKLVPRYLDYLEGRR